MAIVAEDQLRVLVVGAGPAGLTLAAKLVQQPGRHVEIVERADELADVGYAIGLQPLGGNVLHGLGIHSKITAQSEELKQFELYDRNFNYKLDMDMAKVNAESGASYMMKRTLVVQTLAELLPDACIRFGERVAHIEDQGARKVKVQFQSGVESEYDVVVACDGISSKTRSLMFPADTPAEFETGWTAWTWYTKRPEDLPATNAREYWGNGILVGIYVHHPEECMVVMVLPARYDTQERALERANELVPQEKLDTDPVLRAVLSVPEGKLYPWQMRDIRAPRWHAGRLALCGDSACAFLPTAGVGASNAIRAAASLADELSRVNADLVHVGLEVYEKRCRERVEANQQASRNLARACFVESSAINLFRDALFTFLDPAVFVEEIAVSVRSVM
mmetsp:Transcript_6197/g.17489  ORF Transcript_6197/g.17489 Transcript_6197/m.17489 type:complete len:392 (+) Transcript_6197:189-1364(+)|eukprot:CAMPEP_0119120302 /NCGR_PEP_ID=MMETSP1310-20130426/1398_1 /TAXON_ID=464262 /ORGANISM="Genus nov. species nov., Strain RCC2339" /LENGTH=391 /DNA_ID=CAMNT_0007109773 /DNA_START=178 /DNA_END=1353 /DNA_ORIENTATION=+